MNGPVYPRRRLAAVLVAASLVLGGALAAPSGVATATAPPPPGAQTRFPLPDAGAKPTSIVTGADGALWIAESGAGAIVRMTTDGATTRFPLPSGANPTALAAGPDGTIWWIADNDTWGTVHGGALLVGADTGTHVDAVGVTSDGIGLIALAGTGSASVLLVTSPAKGPIEARGITLGHAVTAPTRVASIDHKIWVSDAAANVIVVFTEAGVYERSITINAPTAMTPGDGGVYVVSENSRIIKLNLDGTLTGWGASRDGYPFISDVLPTGGGELWFPSRRANTVSVQLLRGGVPPRADLPEPQQPTDITLGPDENVWYTTFTTGEVVRVLHDYAVPGRGIQYAGMVEHLAYVGEPLGPVALSDRGSEPITAKVTGTIPEGMRIDSARPGILTGLPTSVGRTAMGISLSNPFYGGDEANLIYGQALTVREKPIVSRLGGADRYEVAANASKTRFGSGARTVYLASGEKFADALSAGAVAIGAKAPLLLTTADGLPAPIEGEIRRLKPTRIIIAGGPASVSDAVVAKLKTLGLPGLTVDRIGGADRYDVSQHLIETTTASTTLYLASGTNYPDALSAAPVAGANGSNVLLVNGTAATLPANTMAFLTARGITTIKIAGGPNSITDSIRDQLRTAGLTVTRLNGPTRYDSSVAINRDTLTAPGVDSRNPENPVPLTHSDTVYLASGETFPDALSGGVAAGLQGAPLYVVPKNCVPRHVLLDIGSTGATTVTILGGTNTLSTTIENLTVCT